MIFSFIILQNESTKCFSAQIYYLKWENSLKLGLFVIFSTLIVTFRNISHLTIFIKSQIKKNTPGGIYKTIHHYLSEYVQMTLKCVTNDPTWGIFLKMSFSHITIGSKIAIFCAFLRGGLTKWTKNRYLWS